MLLATTVGLVVQTQRSIEGVTYVYITISIYYSIQSNEEENKLSNLKFIYRDYVCTKYYIVCFYIFV